jgi:N6-L-threonylcarbamoyladenine synthase
LRLFRETASQPAAMAVAGGVAANGAIRRALMRFCGEAGLRLVVPAASLCTDNGAMIAWAGIERLLLGLVDDMTFAARPRWPLDANAEAAHHGKA